MVYIACCTDQSFWGLTSMVDLDGLVETGRSGRQTTESASVVSFHRKAAFEISI